MNILKIALVTLISFSILSCASDSHINERMDKGYYTEVILSLGYKFTYNYENADKYINYHLGVLAEYGYFSANNMLALNSLESHFKSSISNEDIVLWGTKKLMFEFYSKSAEAGFSPAMMKLALLADKRYENYGNSLDWINEAARHGNPEAIKMLGDSGAQIPRSNVPIDIVHIDLIEAESIDMKIEHHDPALAYQKKIAHQKEVQDRIALIKDVVVATAAIAVAGYIASETSSGTRNTNTTYTTTNYVPPLRISAPLPPPSRVKAITSASAGFLMPKSPTASYNTTSTGFSTPTSAASSTPTIYATRSSTISPPTQPQAGQCSNDFACGYGQKCVKAPLSSYGTCMTEVDQSGIPTYSGKDTDSVLPNMNIGGQCSFNTDCPVSFKCDQKLKVCTK